MAASALCGFSQPSVCACCTRLSFVIGREDLPLAITSPYDVEPKKSLEGKFGLAKQLTDMLPYEFSLLVDVAGNFMVLGVVYAYVLIAS